MENVPFSDEIPGMGDDRSWQAILAVVVCLVAATVMVGLRIYTRRFMVKEMSKDDWAAILTLLVTYAAGITIAYSTNLGLGKHIVMMDIDNLTECLKLFWISDILHTAGLLTAKMTLVLQYYRVLAVPRMRIVYIIALLVIFGWGVSQIFVKIFICRPIQAFWDPTVEGRECLDTGIQGYVNAIGDIITALAIFVMPIPVLKHLNLPSTERLLLVWVFVLGLFTVAISAIRIKFIQPEDPSWNHVEWAGWAMGELASALTCACLPTLRPFLAKFFSSLAESSVRATLGYNDEKGGDSGESRRGWWPFRPKRAADGKGNETRTDIHEVRHELGNDGAKHEALGDVARYEAPGDGQRHEAPGDELRHEAPGDFPDITPVQRNVYQSYLRRG